MREEVLVSWSGGKDSALALHELLRVGHYRIGALLTVVTEGFDRISMHGVRRVLLEQQAAALGLPLHVITIPQKCTNEQYEACMVDALTPHQKRGIETVVFGDLFLQDVRAYRERNLARAGMRALFPVWERDTHTLAQTFITLGFKAIVVCVDPKVLDRSFAGRCVDEAFLRDLPHDVDPCGENGEFHTFVFAGPMFHDEVLFRIGEVVIREGFIFCDLLPEERKKVL